MLSARRTKRPHFVLLFTTLPGVLGYYPGILMGLMSGSALFFHSAWVFHSCR